MGATPKGIPVPDGDDPPLGPLDFLAMGDWVDEFIGGHTYAEINALTGIEVWEGRRVYQTDEGTDRPQQGLYMYDGADWRAPWNQPWGVVPDSRKTMATDATGYTAMATISGLVTASFVLIDGRMYEGIVRVPFQATGGSGGRGAEFQIVDSVDGTIVIENADATANPPLVLGTVALAFSFDTFTPGLHVWTPQIGRCDDATITLNVGAAQLYVKDIGPADGGSPT